MNNELPPSERLLGMTLEGGYVVSEKINHGPDYTGAQRSVAYYVTKDDKTYFLKALDFSFFIDEADPDEDLATTMQKALTQYTFERGLLTLAKEHSLSRIVRVLGEGSVIIDRIPVLYLIFERADTNMRTLLNGDEIVTVQTKMQALHHVAVGLKQLHKHLIAHQDVKPSNILGYRKSPSETSFKVGDLGQASQSGATALHDKDIIAGDRRFAPLELWYRWEDPDFHRRRTACDLYMFGAMIIYLLLGRNVTKEVTDRLPPEQQPEKWGEPYPKVLPFVRVAFDDFMASIDRAWPFPEDAEIGARLSVAVRQLCAPDPALRGDPTTRLRQEPIYDLQRYISLLALLLKRAEVVHRIKEARLVKIARENGGALV
jgi:eukaryotic-like serine/threonine-protein kinase